MSLARPPEPLHRNAHIQDGMRFWLTRAWDGDKPILPVIGNNPSDADDKKDDPTIIVTMKFAYAWGFGGIVMLNPYPYIASDMRDLREWAKRPMGDVDFMAINRGAVIRWLKGKEVCLAAWGNLPDPEVLATFLSHIRIAYPDLKWMCLGTTKDGAPKHPMARGKHRIPNNQQLVPWEVSYGAGAN